MARGAAYVRGFSVAVCVLTFALALVAAAAGAWPGAAALLALSLAFAYLAVFIDDERLLRVNRWIAAVLHWSP